MGLGTISWFGLLVISSFFVCSRCYDAIDYEIFDLVEEVNKNFYDVFGLDSKASTSEIKRAYRRLAVKYHPDKNTDKGAEEFFRQIAAVYDVLKDDDKRQRYDIVLQTGLPDWKQPVFYYRRVRKLGLRELAVILLMILTVGHYLVLWATYLERRYVVEELFRSRRRKDRKSRSHNRAQALEEKEQELEEELVEQLSAIPRPRLSQLLPYKLVEWTWLALLYIIHTPSRWREWYKEREEERKLEQLEREEEERRREEINRLHEASKNKKRINLAELRAQMMNKESQDKPITYSATQDNFNQTEQCTTHHDLKKAGEEWSEEEISLLAKAVVKYPSGIPQRWQKIADMLQRPVKEVTAMAKSLKQGYSRPIDVKAQGITGAVDEVITSRSLRNFEDITQVNTEEEDNLINSAVISAGNAAVRRRKRHNRITPSGEGNATQVKSEENCSLLRNSVHMRTQNLSSNESQTANDNVHSEERTVNINSTNRALWSQEQQKLLEQALVCYPRGTLNRWDAIAECIPGKTKEDCITRFKYLAEIVRKKKELQQSAQ